MAQGQRVIAAGATSEKVKDSRGKFGRRRRWRRTSHGAKFVLTVQDDKEGRHLALFLSIRTPMLKGVRHSSRNPGKQKFASASFISVSEVRSLQVAVRPWHPLFRHGGQKISGSPNCRKIRTKESGRRGIR